MAKDEEDPGEAIFVAVVACLVLGGLFAILIYSGKIHDLLTGSIAVGILVVYVVASTFLAPLVIATAPTKGQSTYDAVGNPRQKQRTPPLAYLFALIMPGYFIGKTVRWLWGLVFGGGKK